MQVKLHTSCACRTWRSTWVRMLHFSAQLEGSGLSRINSGCRSATTNQSSCAWMAAAGNVYIDVMRWAGHYKNLWWSQSVMKSLSTSFCNLRSWTFTAVLALFQERLKLLGLLCTSDSISANVICLCVCVMRNHATAFIPLYSLVLWLAFTFSQHVGMYPESSVPHSNVICNGEHWPFYCVI